MDGTASGFHHGLNGKWFSSWKERQVVFIMEGTASGEPSLPPPFLATIIGGTEKYVQFKSYYFEGKKWIFSLKL